MAVLSWDQLPDDKGETACGDSWTYLITQDARMAAMLPASLPGGISIRRSPQDERHRRA